MLKSKGDDLKKLDGWGSSSIIISIYFTTRIITQHDLLWKWIDIKDDKRDT